MVRVEKTFLVNAPADKVMAAMRDPELIERSEKSRNALEVVVKTLDQTEKTHEFEIHTVTYALSIKGVDKNKTEQNRTDVSWDLEKRQGRWVYNGAHSPMVQINGGYDLEQKGEDNQLSMFVEIKVNIPLVGKVVAGKIRDGFLSEWPKYVDRVEHHAQTL